MLLTSSAVRCSPYFSLVGSDTSIKMLSPRCRLLSVRPMRTGSVMRPSGLAPRTADQVEDSLRFSCTTWLADVGRALESVANAAVAAAVSIGRSIWKCLWDYRYNKKSHVLEVCRPFIHSWHVVLSCTHVSEPITNPTHCTG